MSSGRRCRWCACAISPRAAATSVFCSQRCRQAAFRLRRRSWPRNGAEAASLATAATGAHVPAGSRFAYADPPYPGLAAKYYAGERSFAGEVDHEALIRRLQAGRFAGWALSTSARALRFLLPLCPPEVRVLPWVKPIGASPATFGLHSTWEALLVVGGRVRRPGVRDWLYAQPTRGWGELPGRKPLAFCAWLFDCLGMQPGDRLVDLFPGTRAVSRAWAEIGGRPECRGARYQGAPVARGSRDGAFA